MHESKPPHSMASVTDWSDGDFAPLPDGEVVLLQRLIHVSTRGFRRTRGLPLSRKYKGCPYTVDYMSTASKLANEQFTPVYKETSELWT